MPHAAGAHSSGVTQPGGWININRGQWYFVQVYYLVGSGTSGNIQWWLDDTLEGSRLAYNNSAKVPRYFRLADIQGVDAGTSGKVYYDDAKVDTATIQQSGPYLYTSIAALPSGVWKGGVRLTNVATKTALDSQSKWWYDTTNQRVYISQASAPSDAEIQTRNYGIDTTSVTPSHIAIDGLDFQKQKQNIRLYSWSTAASDWTIQNSSFQTEPNTGDISTAIYGTGNTGTFDGITVTNNTITPWPNSPLTYVNNSYGIYFTGVTGKTPVSNFLIDDNVIGPAGKHAICVWHASTGTISNNTTGGNAESSIDVKDTPYVKITRNVADNDGEYSIIYDAVDVAGSTHDGEVSYNHVTRGGQNHGVDHGHGPNLYGDIALHATQNTVVKYNVVETSWGSGIYLDDYASIGGGHDNSVIYNVVNGNGTGVLLGGIDLGDVVNGVVYGNTVYTAAQNGLYFSGGAHSTGNVIKNNIVT
jgi:hypothetical protein